MEWKSIKGYEGYYEVSSEGKVRSVERTIMNKTKNGKPRPCFLKSKELKHYVKDTGRIQVVLSKNCKTKSFDVHVLAAETFLEKPTFKCEVNHKDGNLLNNNIENLEWITREENIKHAFSNGLYTTMKKVALLNQYGEIVKVYPSESCACRDFGVAQGKIGRSIRRNGKCKNEKWKFVDESVTTTEKWTSPTE